MSNKKTFTEITATDAKKKGVTALALRPNDASRFGQGGLTADALKAWFDQLPKEIISKLNSVMKALNSSEGGKYIGIDAPIDAEVDNLHDFLALFGERGTGLNDKSIADYIQTLYSEEGEAVAASRDLKTIIADIAARLESGKADHEELTELIESAFLKVDTDNVIHLDFDTGDKTVKTSAKINPVKTAGIADGAVTNGKIASKAVTADKIADGAVTNSKIASSLMQTIKDAFIEVEYDPKTGNLKFNSLGGSMSVNLPLEMVVSNGRFDEAAKDIVLVLNNGEEIRIPLDDFVDQVAEDIAVLKKSFNGAAVSNNKLVFVTHDGSKVEVDLPSSGGGGNAVGAPSAKLYRHDIHLTEYYFGLNDVWLTIYNTDPTNYSVVAGFTEYDENDEWLFEYTEPLTEQNYAFLPPNAEIVAIGAMDWSGTGDADETITAIKYIPQTGLELYGMRVGEGWHQNAESLSLWSFERMSEIIDTVTEISGQLENGDVVRY